MPRTTAQLPLVDSGFPAVVSLVRLSACQRTPWSSRALPHALSPERLGALVDRAVAAADGLLFTATPREELAAIGHWQVLKDQAFAGQLRAIVAAWNRASEQERFFAGDEVGLAIGSTSTTGGNLVMLARSVAELPGLLESLEAGTVTERHVRAVMAELDRVELGLEQRQAVVLIALARFEAQTPGELASLVKRLILTVDRAAALAREQQGHRGPAGAGLGGRGRAGDGERAGAGGADRRDPGGADRCEERSGGRRG